MAKEKSVSLKITNCLDCPHHKKITSQYTGDSFDMADEDVICTLANGGPHRGAHETVKGRMIVGSERWNLRKYTTVSTWCPLTRRTKHHDTTPEGTHARALRGRVK
jgi:hypothetical protein